MTTLATNDTQESELSEEEKYLDTIKLNDFENNNLKDLFKRNSAAKAEFVSRMGEGYKIGSVLLMVQAIIPKDDHCYDTLIAVASRNPICGVQ